MNKLLFIALAATLTLVGQETNARDSLILAGPTVAGNITQSQSGWGNSQSINIGSTIGRSVTRKGRRISSTQSDPETGNQQSADVSGSGNISQRQSGRNNSQTLVIDGSSGTPSITQSQTGVNRKQSIKIDGKKIEMSP